MNVLFFIVLLVYVVSSRVISLGTIAEGGNITTAFLDPHLMHSNKSVILKSSDRSSLYNTIININIILGVPIMHCVMASSGISTCDNGTLFYPHYSEYLLLEDTDHPERVGVWTVEEYGYTTVVPSFDAIRTTMVSYLTYYDKKNKTNYELILVGSTSLSDPQHIELIGNIDQLVYVTGVSNYTYMSAPQDVWTARLVIKTK
jgi:hypothetical protein